MLHLKGFVPSADKVKQLDLHPVQPWVATASKGDVVHVWDWSTQTMLLEMTVTAAEDDALQDAVLNRLGEKDGAFTGNPSANRYQGSRSAAGHVRQLKFLDVDVAYWQSSIQHHLVNGTSSPPPTAAGVSALEGQRWLLLVCDQKLLLLDLESRKTQELSRSLLDNKSPVAVALLFKGGQYAPGFTIAPGALMAAPILAVGCSDGIVRLVQLGVSKVLARLQVTTKGSITQMMTLPHKGGLEGSADMLLVGDSTGHLHVFDPLARPLASAPSLLTPKVSMALHEKELLSMVLVGGPEETREVMPFIFTTGVDGCLVRIDASTLKVLNKTKQDSKTAATCLAFSPRYFSVSGANNLLMTTASSVIQAMHIQTAAVRPLCNLAGLIPCGNKKIPKPYVIAVHPLFPNFVAIGTNSGMAFMAFEPVYPLPALALPPPTLSRTRLSDPSGPSAADVCSYVIHLGDAIWNVCAVTELQEDKGEEGAYVPKVLSVDKVGGTGGAAGRAVLGCSHQGAYVSVVFPATRMYLMFYKTAEGGWTECDRGSAVALAWHSSADVFAVVEEPGAVTTAPKVKSKSKKLFGKSEPKGPDVAEVRAAMEAANAMVALHTCVKIRALDGLMCNLVCDALQLKGDSPLAVHGGPMLAVTYRRPYTDDSSSTPAPGTSLAMQFYSWESRQPVGEDLEEPMTLCWDPTLSMCAMVYNTHVLVFRLKPVFECIGTVAVAHVSGAVWSTRQLYLVNPTSVFLAYVNEAGSTLPNTAYSPATTPDQPPALQVVLLADVQISSATSSLLADASLSSLSLPAPCMRAPGPLALLGPRGYHLYMVTAQGQLTVVPLLHPGLLVRSLCVQGDLLGAGTVAQNRVEQRHHDQLAAFMCLMGGPRAAEVALRALPGLSVETEAELCLCTGQWQQALCCCEALLLGCHDRSQLTLSPEFQERARSTSILGRLGGRSPLPANGLVSSMDALHLGFKPGQGPLSNPVSQFGIPMWEQPEEKEAPEAEDTKEEEKAPDIPPTDIDWTAPLRNNWTGSKNTPRSEEPSSPDSAAGPILRVPPSRRAIELTLRLMDQCLNAGRKDLASAALHLLLRHRQGLQPIYMARLATKMSAVDMHQELRELVDVMVTAGAHDAQAIGLISAALSGNLEELQAALQTSGALSLAALQANSYHLKCAQDTERLWNDKLRAAGRELAMRDGENFAFFKVSRVLT